MTLNLNRLKNENPEAVKRADKAEDDLETIEQNLRILEDKIALVPQAEVNHIYHKEITRGRGPLSKKGMEIGGKFSVSNRKGIKVRVVAYFYFADERPLRDNNGKNEHNGQVAVGQDFTPDYVRQENKEFKFFIAYDELHVGQPAVLKFKIRVYDKTTVSFLETVPYEKEFRFNPFSDPKID